MKNSKWVPHFKWMIGEDGETNNLEKKHLKALDKKFNGITSDNKGTAKEIRTAFKDATYADINEITDGAMEGVGCVEFSIIRKNYALGFESYGWDGSDKIVAFDNIEFADEKALLWAVDVVETMAKALNAKGL